MSLRNIVLAKEDDPWFIGHRRDILFELNHLELHDQDDYLFQMHQRNIKAAENPNNSNLAYLLGITDKEPTGRIKTVGGSFPDIDLDFEKDRREEVKQHLVDKYGADRVASIGTFMFPKPKGLWKDVARLYNLDFTRSNEISKLIPDDPELKTFDQALEMSKDFKHLYDTDPLVKEIVEYGKKLEGTVKTVGVHACLGAESRILTSNGYLPIGELANSTCAVLTSGGFIQANVISSGTKDLHKLYYSSSKYSSSKRFIVITEDHLVSTTSGWLPAKKSIGKCLESYTMSNSFDLTSVMSGWFWNDGNAKKSGGGYIYLTPGMDDDAKTLFSGFMSPCSRRDRYHVTKDFVCGVDNRFGDGFRCRTYEKNVPKFKSLGDKLGWLCGFFSANATVQRGCIRLKITSKSLIDFIISELATLNIFGCVSSVPSKENLFSNGAYITKESFQFEISVNDSWHFNQIIGFIQSHKSEKIKPMIVQEIEFIRRDNVYDFSILTSSDGLRHSFVDGVIVHNCGVCISIDPITDIVPLFASKDGAVTQYDGETLEKIGLIKYDILGLKNLSVISRTFELIKKVRGIDLGVIDILPDDPDAYEVITSGNSYGVFQIEGSQGLRDFAAAARPTNLTELAAVISLNLEW